MEDPLARHPVHDEQSYPQWVERREKKKKNFGLRGDRHELSVYSIHPQSDAHWTKVWEYRSTPPFRE